MNIYNILIALLGISAGVAIFVSARRKKRNDLIVKAQIEECNARITADLARWEEERRTRLEKFEAEQRERDEKHRQRMADFKARMDRGEKPTPEDFGI